MSKIAECCRKATYHATCSLLLLALTSMVAPVHATVTPPAPSCGEEPADIVLMLDRTGSVSTTNRNLERDAARDFIDAVAGLSNGTRISIGRFGDGTDGGLEAEIRASLSTDYAALKTATTNALSSNSSVGTNVRDAINVAQKELDDHAIFDSRVIVLLSDGDANEPGTSSNARAVAEAAATTAKGKGTIIFTVAFDSSGSGDEVFRDSLASMATQPSADDSVGAVSAAEQTAENSDGDHFLIASNGSVLASIFLDTIFENIRCDDHDPCTKDVCNEDTDKCVFTTIPNCKSCEDAGDCTDGNACNGAETCGANGTCQSGTPLSCTDEDACTANSCDPATGCVSTPVDCDDHNPCTADSCDKVNGCQHVAVEGCKRCEDADDCDNNNKCDGAEFCGDDGTCHSGSAPNCADEDACTVDSCDPLVGCLHNAKDCDDANECTADSCDVSGECKHDKVSCDDQDACTADSCDPESGCAHADVSCEDHNPCTADSCDTVNGCQNVPIEGCKTCEDSDDCDNHNACDGAEVCEDGTCHAGTPPNCEDDSECTSDSCDPKSGCVHQAVSCEDQDACTGDSCNPDTGCSNTTISCEDQNACTVESCDANSGCQHQALDCDDLNPCTVESCDPINGCQHEFIEGCQECEGDEDCDNHNVCDGAEICGENHTCQSGEGPNCDDEDKCTVDSCDPESGCLHEDAGLCNPPPCPDADQDGVCDPDDNCVNTPNPNQEDDNHNGVGNACEQPGGDSGGVGGPGGPSILQCLQGSGVSGKASDPRCSGFACSLNRGAVSVDGTVLAGWLLMGLGALTPWILLKRRVPAKARRPRD